MNKAQLEPLKEVASIGAGHGATALSKLLDQKVLMDAPGLDLIKVEDVPELIGIQDQIETVVLSKLIGEVSGIVLFIINPKTAAELTVRLTNDVRLTQSALNEIVNIFLGNALKAVVSFLKMEISHSPPTQATDILGALVDPVISKIGEKTEQVLIIDLKLSVGELKSKFLFLADPKSTINMVNKLNHQVT